MLTSTKKRNRKTRPAIPRLLAVCLCSLLCAQSATLEFEVASIKPSVQPHSGVIRLGQQGGPGTDNPGRITYGFSTIRDLMEYAYSVRRSQVSGGPGWLDTERFDIVAKVPAGTTREQVPVMLQNLLQERFQLTFHRETKELPVYALVVGPKGPKLKDSAVAKTPPAPDAQPPASHLGVRGMKLAPDGCPVTAPIPAGRGGNFTVVTPNGACLISHAQTMEGLAREFSNRFDRPVIDQTGLQGTYDVRLRYDPSSIPTGRGGPIGKETSDVAGPAQTGAADADKPSIFEALQEQLGLKLERKKASVELLVIDHVNKMPVQN